MAELMPLYSKTGEVLEPITLGEYVTMDNGDNLDAMMSKTQLFSPTIEVDSAMNRVGVGSGVDYHANIKDGAYEECVFEGRTKWIDNDTGDILDEFATDRNLSLIDVKMPILRNTGKNLFNINGDINQKFNNLIAELDNVLIGNNGFVANNYTYQHHGKGIILNLKSNTTYTISGKVENYGSITIHSRNQTNIVQKQFLDMTFSFSYTTTSTTELCLAFATNGIDTTPKARFFDVQIEESPSQTTYEDHKTNILRTSEEIVLRGVNGVQNTYNALTGEYVQRIGERVYEQGDELNRLVKTDMTNTQYELSEPVITIVKPSTTPFAYANGHVILESGYDGRSLLPLLKYSVVASRTGQITQNAKTIMRHEERITSLEDLLLTQIVEMDYERVLLQFDYELQMMNLG